MLMWKLFCPKHLGERSKLPVHFRLHFFAAKNLYIWMLGFSLADWRITSADGTPFALGRLCQTFKMVCFWNVFLVKRRPLADKIGHFTLFLADLLFSRYFFSRINETRQVKVWFVPVPANPVLTLVRARQKYSSLLAPSLDWLVQLTHSHQPGPPTTHP